MADLPTTMRSLVAPRKCTPSSYEVGNIPIPQINLPTEVLIKVHSAAIMTGDTQMANNKLPMFYKPPFPFSLGQQGSGTVVEVGPGIQDFKVGDPVYSLNIEKPMFRGPPAAFVSQYAVVKEKLLLHKPAHLTFEDASSLIGNTVTAYQIIRRGLQRMGCDSLEGKTVFVPAGLSSTGSIAIQVAKNVFGASRIITTVSTPKVGLVERCLPGIVDEVVDYKTEKLTDRVKRGRVDLMLNTQFSALTPGIPLVNPKKGVVMLIAGIPNQEIVKEMLGDRTPWWLGPVLGIAQWYYTWLFWGTQIQYEMVSGSPDIREDLEKIGEMIVLGEVKAVTTVVGLSDVEGVKRECQKVHTSKGGVGNLVIRVDETEEDPSIR